MVPTLLVGPFRFLPTSSFGAGAHCAWESLRPRTAEVTVSLLKRAKANGFTALVITLDTMTIGWRPHDIETAYLPFAYGVGIQVGTSDPVFMKRFGLEPRQGESTVFPFEPEKVRDAASAKGDKRVAREMLLGKEWLGEVNAGVFRSWEDLKFIRDNWDGPIVLKGIQRVSVSTWLLEEGLVQYMTQFTLRRRRTRRERSHTALMESLFRTTVCLFTCMLSSG